MAIPAYIWSLATLLICSPLTYLVGRRSPQVQNTHISQWFCLLAMGGASYFMFWSILHSEIGSYFRIGTILLHLDGLSVLLAIIALGLGMLTALFSAPYLSNEGGKEKFFAMLLALVGSIIGLGYATDIFNLWIWYEAMAITSYLLVAFYRDNPPSLEAGFKYLVQNAIGSTLVLVGIGIVFSQTNTLNLMNIVASSQSLPLIHIAGALLFIGFGVKAAIFPLHTWLPDAHSQAPSGISAMLSGIVIEAGLIAQMRSLRALYATSLEWPELVIGFGILNIFVGNLMALRQKQVKRLLAFSSVAHMGYILLGIGITLHSGDIQGMRGGLFHLFNHGVMKGLAFLAAGCLVYGLHISKGDHQPMMIEELAGASQRYPLVAFTFSLALLGLGGLPPLAGFMSKWQIFYSGFATHNISIIILMLFAALNSVISLAYYAPIINAMYRLHPHERIKSSSALPPIMLIPLVSLALLEVLIGFYPSLLNWLINPASLALQTAVGG